MDWLDFVILAFASFRITHLFVYDKIMEWFRAPFFDEVKIIEDHGKEETYIIPKKNGIKGFIGELLHCYWCTGVWSAAICYGIYVYVPLIGIPLLTIFAVAGIAAIAETIVQRWSE
ncbi:DUF1360 domain-containing protein [Mangrovibacillus cuniculi]|uniref:DUF1360 domain-containing protein n=1 Tax=Mangrovibacillus cuniculi TaxID=2593652 RepID=A0A7S8C9V6_9BACI|nr:DUF1360 domain-containing protein [Mangrovibacillus cuniculi]QPC46096.1 DUF1360 domain-containing protein [Mangrovibacillus cuniculi]